MLYMYCQARAYSIISKDLERGLTLHLVWLMLVKESIITALSSIRSNVLIITTA